MILVWLAAICHIPHTLFLHGECFSQHCNKNHSLKQDDAIWTI